MVGLSLQALGSTRDQTTHTEGLIMAPCRRNAMTPQTLRRRREPVLVLRRVSVSGPITALAAATHRQKFTIFLGGVRQALAVDARRVRKDVTGP